MPGRGALVLLALMLVSSTTARGQDTIVLFDENDEVGADYRAASSGTFEAPDTLHLIEGTKLPLAFDHAFSGESSGLLAYRHAGGSWQVAIGPDEGVASDLTGFDSLIVYLNGPTSIPGGELPRIHMEDEDGGRTEPVWLSPLENVRTDDEATGFTPESETNAIIDVSYVEGRPASERRPGYPEDLTITFANEPLDTSVAGIGVPAVPAHFEIVTATGLRPEFRFRDLNGDGTLSHTDEHIEVRFPEAEGSPRMVTTWKFTLAHTQGPGPLDPPGEGDVYHLALAFEEFTLDGDADTWQRLSIPFDELTARGDFSPAQLGSVVFEHGGRNDDIRTLWFDRLVLVKNDDTDFLEFVQEHTFTYFWEEANPANGLVRDRSRPGSPASIAAVGFGLSALTVGVDRGWITREQGRNRVAATLRFFWNAPQSTAADATGYKGFFYHFLDMQTGRRVWESELSTIDTALLLGGVLHVREYFGGETAVEEEIRALADSIYQRVDFAWMQFRHAGNPSPAISHGWRPESGFIRNDWLGYNEAMILYILALGSPTHPASADAWDAWVSGYGAQWRTEYGYTFLTFPPLFGHQYSHVWIDFRGIRDAYMRDKGIDYFENSRRATLAQRAYHMDNPRGYPNYGKNEWGLTASDTPTGYRARGAPPPQNDDGTLVPTAPGGSIVFTPDESIAALRTMYETHSGRLWGPYGFRDAYNVQQNWFDEDYIGIDQGPILLMIENHRTETIWELTMQHEAIQLGLARAGFTGVDLASEGVPAGGALEIATFPNPASRLAHVRYRLGSAGEVMLSLYDVLGRRLARLDRGYKLAGDHQVEADLSSFPSGMYFVVLEASSGTATKSIAVMR